MLTLTIAIDGLVTVVSLTVALLAGGLRLVLELEWIDCACGC